MVRVVVNFAAEMERTEAEEAKKVFEANPHDGAALIELLEHATPFNIEIVKVWG